MVLSPDVKILVALAIAEKGKASFILVRAWLRGED